MGFRIRVRGVSTELIASQIGALSSHKDEDERQFVVDEKELRDSLAQRIVPTEAEILWHFEEIRANIKRTARNKITEAILKAKERGVIRSSDDGKIELVTD